jgi:hypothetical protein
MQCNLQKSTGVGCDDLPHAQSSFVSAIATICRSRLPVMM